MRVLFLHDAFPAQFGHVALELTRRHGWDCHFLVESVSSCPTPSPEMLDRLDVRSYPLSQEYRKRDATPWPMIYGKFLELCESAYEAIRRRPELKPDLIVAHGGRGAPTVLLRDLVDCPIINYCEYYFAFSHRDISYRIDLPPAEPAPHFPRCINAPVLVSLVDCDSGYSATAWQRASFPARFSAQNRGPFRRDRRPALPTRSRTSPGRRPSDSCGDPDRDVRLAWTRVDSGVRYLHGCRQPDCSRAARCPVRGRRQ